MHDLSLYFEKIVHSGRFKYIFLHGVHGSVKFKILIENYPTKSIRDGCRTMYF